jgi:hypothetical protein
VGRNPVPSITAAEDGEFKYYIKSLHEDHERVATKSALRSI